MLVAVLTARILVVFLRAPSIVEHGAVGSVSMLMSSHLVHVVVTILRILLIVASWIPIRIALLTALTTNLRLLSRLSRSCGSGRVLTAALGIMLTEALLSTRGGILAWHILS